MNKKKWVFENGAVTPLSDKQMQDDLLNGKPRSSIPFGYQFWVWTPYKPDAIEQFAALCPYLQFIELVFDHCKGKNAEVIDKNGINLN